jgi:type I restriction enzyme S subunit
MPRADWSVVANGIFSFPALPEQTKIANFLTAVDDKLTQLKKKKNLLEKYKKGVMQKLFSQELRFKNEDGEFYEEWEETTVGEVVEFRNGKAHENDIDEDGKYIVVNSRFISQNGKIRKYSNQCIMPLFKDEIVMVMSDVPNGKAIAKCFLIDENDKYTLNQRICALKAMKCYNPFLFYLINRNEYYLSFDSGVGQTNLRKEEVLNCPISIPVSLPEQTKIANFLTAIDDKINHCGMQIEKMEGWKKGLLQRMFV